MATTVRQDREFLTYTLVDTVDDLLLERSIEWIRDNMEPEEVFSDEALTQWAADKGFMKE